MSKPTDSQIVEYNEDGSWTTTTVVTEYPATKKQQAAAIGVLGAMCVAPFVPILGLYAVEKWEARKLRKQEAKQEKNS